MIIKNKKYILSGGISTLNDNHFTAFLVNYSCGSFNFEIEGNYYFDGMLYLGAIIKINDNFDCK